MYSSSTDRHRLDKPELYQHCLAKNTPSNGVEEEKSSGFASTPSNTMLILNVLEKQHWHVSGSCLCSSLVFVQDRVFRSVVTCSVSLWRAPLVPWIVKLEWLEGGCNLGAVRYGFQSSAAREVISNQRSLIGIWLCESQATVLIHPNRINSLAIKEMWDKGSFNWKKKYFLYL